MIDDKLVIVMIILKVSVLVVFIEESVGKVRFDSMVNVWYGVVFSVVIEEFLFLEV